LALVVPGVRRPLYAAKAAPKAAFRQAEHQNALPSESDGAGRKYDPAIANAIVKSADEIGPQT